MSAVTIEAILIMFADAATGYGEDFDEAKLRAQSALAAHDEQVRAAERERMLTGVRDEIASSKPIQDGEPFRVALTAGIDRALYRLDAYRATPAEQKESN